MDEGKKKTASNIELKLAYCAADIKSSGVDQELPGGYPFTRGIHSDMYRGKLWTMRQYAGFGTAAEANKRYHYLLKQGTTGLSIAFDLPTQMGRDPDHPLSKGEVGRVGVAISSVDDMETLLKGIPLENVSISMTINATAAILLGFLLIVAERRKVPWGKLRGTIQNDILKEYIARGTYIYPPKAGLRIVTDIFQFCGENVSNWNTISISGYHIREAGSTAVEEVAFTLADGIAYVEAALKAGLKIDDFAPRIAFFLNCHSDFLEEIAKFRAARRLWAKIMQQRFKAKNERSKMFRFHTQTAGSSLTAQQPLNNITRTTLQALAAVLGGTQSLHTNGYDEALGLPTEESAEIALRIQQIIAYESGAASCADPLGGSYLIEHLTTSIEHEALKRIEHIDSLGGMVCAIEQGYPQREIQRSAYEFQRAIEKGDAVVVGVNRFVSEHTEPEIHKSSAHGETEQIQRIQKIREIRSQQLTDRAIQTLNQAARTRANVMSPLLDAIRANATLGEISDALRAVFGEYVDAA